VSNLAILICTLPERADKLKRLTNILDPQIERHKDKVYTQKHDAGRGMPTGTKRNLLIEQTTSDYFCFADDDDHVSAYYVDEIVKAMQTGPDVITFNGWMTTHGANRQNFTIKLGSRYEEKNGHFYRFPNHLCVFKREKVRHIKFPDLWVQEDYLWAKQIHDRGLLKTEVHIEEDLYWYDCNPVMRFAQRRAR
jgi:hypothetical protein